MGKEARAGALVTEQDYQAAEIANLRERVVALASENTDLKVLNAWLKSQLY